MSVPEWPPSPPLQNLHREELAGGRSALLLVGAAGRGHWSASVEAAPREARLLFDLACRVETVDGWIGNRYRLHRGAAARLKIASDEADVTWSDLEVEIRPRSIQRPTVRWRFAVDLVP